MKGIPSLISRSIRKSVSPLHPVLLSCNIIRQFDVGAQNT